MSKSPITADYDTILVAAGRYAQVSGLGLENIGVTLSKGGKIVTDAQCKIISDTCTDVYAIGDVVEGKLELTPTAILDGKLLAGRLLNVHQEQMNWDLIATTVFTPLEYGCIGLNEEQCVER